MGTFSASGMVQNVIQILDLDQARENVRRYAEAVRPTEESRKEYADQLCALMEAGRTDDLLSELKYRENQIMKPGVPDLYTFIRNNRDSMNYPEYARMGLFTGGGGGGRTGLHSTQERMKLPGARWNVVNARHMLCLRAHQEARTWNCVEEVIRSRAAAGETFDCGDIPLKF